MTTLFGVGPFAAIAIAGALEQAFFGRRQRRQSALVDLGQDRIELLLGFLRFNLPPASIYMGDAGSMLIGLCLGTVALMCHFKGSATMAMMVPLAVWAVPIIDSLAALLRRKLTGRSMYATDRGHLHHVLLHRGYSGKQVLFLIIVFCLITTTGALLSVFMQREWIAPATVFSLVALLLASRSFGHVEAALVHSHLAQMVGRNSSDQKSIEHSVHLQGTREWKTIWSALTESGERFDLAYIKLNLNLPHMHEGFYASWKRKLEHEPEHCWNAELPISLQGHVVGRLEVAGLPDTRSVSLHISQFLDFVEPFEAGLAALLLAQTEVGDSTGNGQSVAQSSSSSASGSQLNSPSNLASGNLLMSKANLASHPAALSVIER